jgi:hypothetical protein
VAEEDVATGVSRREVLRRGAALGAALAVASPVVQGMGRVGAFAAVSPPPGEEDPDADFISNFQVLFTKLGSITVFGIKFDGDARVWESIDAGWDTIGQGVSCWDPDSFEDGKSSAAAFASTVSAVVENGKGVFYFQPPAASSGVEIVEVRGSDGQGSTGATDRCTAPISPVNGVYRIEKP